MLEQARLSSEAYCYPLPGVAMVYALQDINEIYECEQPEEPESMEMRLLIYMMGSTWSVKQ